jgi:hypothetical protein
LKGKAGGWRLEIEGRGSRRKKVEAEVKAKLEVEPKNLPTQP